MATTAAIRLRHGRPAADRKSEVRDILAVIGDVLSPAF
jgi:hypothetical protein